MALTAAQWFSKLSKFVPSWYFTEDTTGLTVAVFMATAAVFNRIQQDADDQQKATFILQSSAPILDLLGDERGIQRNPGELDAAYAVRVQNGLFTSVGETEIETLVNACLNNGVGQFIENSQYAFFDDPNDTTIYYDEPNGDLRWIDRKKWYNWWTVIIPIQTGGDQNAIRAATVATIEKNKALGTTYDILYLSTDDTDADD